jgi:hypothetical protein
MQSPTFMSGVNRTDFAKQNGVDVPGPGSYRTLDDR